MKGKLLQSRYSPLWDFFLPVIAVFVFTWQPYFCHGIINFNELSLYLPDINEIMHGKVLFRDIIVNRGPLEIYLPALLMRIFGVHLNVLLAVFYFGGVLGLVFMALIAQRLLRRRLFFYFLIPVLTAFAYSLVYYKDWGGARFAFGAAAIWFGLRFFESSKLSQLFLSGLCAGIGFLFSVEMGVFPFLAVTSSLFFRQKRRAFKELAVCICGFAAVMFPALLSLLYSSSLKAFLESTLVTPFVTSTVYNYRLFFPDVPRSPIGAFRYAFSFFHPSFRYCLPNYLYLALGFFLIKRYLKKSFGSREVSIFCLGLYGLLTFAGSFRQANGPQFMIASGPAFVLLFVLLEEYFLKLEQASFGKYSHGFILKLGRISICALIFFLVYSAAFTVKNRLVYGFDLNRVIFRQISKGDFPSGIKPGVILVERARGVLAPDWQADEVNAVVNYILENTRPGEIVFGFPFQGGYNFLADRPCLGRFGMGELALYTPQWFQELMYLLKEKRASLILMKNEPEVYEPMFPEMQMVKQRRQVRSFIEHNYQKVKTFGLIDIYSNKNGKN